MKKILLLMLLAIVVLSVLPTTAFANDYAWVLVETQYRHGRDYDNAPIGTWSYAHNRIIVGQKQHEIIIRRDGRLPTDSPQNMHAIYSWNGPPTTIKAGQNVSVTVSRDVKSNAEGGWAGPVSTVVRHGPVGGNPRLTYFVAPDGESYHTSYFSAYPSQSNSYYSVGSLSVDFSFELSQGREGAQTFIDVYSHEASFTTGERYIYEWKRVDSSTPTPSAPAPSPGTSSSGRFSDLPANHWAYSTIIEMVDRGILSGYPDGTFRPNNTISRAEFATIMVKALELQTSRPGTPTFNDVPTSHWAYGVVESAKSYLTGYRNTATGALTFEPTSVAVREDVAVAIVKARGLGNTNANVSLLYRFDDYGQISTALRSHVAIAVEQGYMSGTNKGFEPQKALTRAEACALLSNIIRQDQELESGTEKITLQP